MYTKNSNEKKGLKEAVKKTMATSPEPPKEDIPKPKTIKGCVEYVDTVVENSEQRMNDKMRSHRDVINGRIHSQMGIMLDVAKSTEERVKYINEKVNCVNEQVGNINRYMRETSFSLSADVNALPKEIKRNMADVNRALWTLYFINIALGAIAVVTLVKIF